jgi:hypothetical protein
LPFFADDNAMATACLWGFPSLRSLLMFALMVFWLFPCFNGMALFPTATAPEHFQRFRLKRSGLFGSLAADGCAFIWP